MLIQSVTLTLPQIEKKTSIEAISFHASCVFYSYAVFSLLILSYISLLSPFGALNNKRDSV